MRSIASSAGAGVAAELARLGSADRTALARRWRMLFGKPAPDLPRALLHRIIAYRVQTDAMGYLDAGCAKLLDQLGRSEIDGIPRPERRRIKPAPSGTQRGSCGLCTNFICWLSSRPRTS
jgi:hypothetical protein